MTREESPLPRSDRRTEELPLDFTAFHRMYRERYIRRAERYLRSRADAEDAIDAAFEQLFFVWPEILCKVSPAAYVWRAMKNRVIDHARARGRRPTLVEAAVFETAALCCAEDPIGELEGNLRLFDAISSLPDRQQDVVVLLHLEGYSTAEVADLLGITAATVRSTDRNAKRKLRNLYAEGEGEGQRHDS